MKFQVMPELSPDEYAELKADIAKNGVAVPVIVDENDDIIDGHHRVKIARELGIPCPVELRDELDDAQKVDLAFALNLHRRHLNREQKRELIARSLKAGPQLSNREHARRTGADHKTVQAVREESESTGEIPQSETRLSADGRERPSTQPERKPIADLPATAPITPEDFEELEPETPPSAEPEPVPEPQPRQEKEHRKPLSDDALAATVELSKIVKKWETITTDDRFPRNKEKVNQSHLADLIRARDQLNEIINNLGN